MAVYRVERTRDYTVMSNHHLKDPGLSLKAKGLLAIMLSLPEDWNYSTRGLAASCGESMGAWAAWSTPSMRSPKRRPRTPPGLDAPSPHTGSPDTVKPDAVPPDAVVPDTENPAQLNTKKTNPRKKQNTYRPNTHSFCPQPPPGPGSAPAAEGMTEVYEKRDEIRDQIEYDLIAACHRQ